MFLLPTSFGLNWIIIHHTFGTLTFDISSLTSSYLFSWQNNTHTQKILCHKENVFFIKKRLKALSHISTTTQVANTRKHIEGNCFLRIVWIYVFQTLCHGSIILQLFNIMFILFLMWKFAIFLWNSFIHITQWRVI